MAEAKTTAQKAAPKPAAKKPAAKPAAAKPAAAKKPAAPKAAAKPAAKKPAARKSPAKTALSPAERYKMVEVAAYYIAERNGFEGDSQAFWAEAEIQISKQLGQ
jgi:hypothetical protein